MFEVQSSISLVLSLVLFGVKIAALVDCVARDNSKFMQVGTMPRRNWLIILGVAVAYHAIDWNPLGIINLIGITAALVYLALLRGSP